MRLSDDTIRGRTVIGADGTAVGTLIELFIDPTGWRIESVSIQLHGDIADRIGAKRSMFHHASIELPVAFLQSVGDAVVLTVDVDHLREAYQPTPDAGPQPVV